MTRNIFNIARTLTTPSRARIARGLVAAAMLSSLALGLSTTAEAAPSTMSTTEFYTDATFSEPAGLYVGNSCFGVVNELVSGEVTPYFIESVDSCDRSTPPQFNVWECSEMVCEFINGNLTCVTSNCTIDGFPGADHYWVIEN